MIFRPKGYGKEQRRGDVVPAEDRPGALEREVEEQELEEQELEQPGPEDNEAHAAGQICARCGAVITAGQDVRLQGDGRWVHEVCPLDLSTS